MSHIKKQQIQFRLFNALNNRFQRNQYFFISSSNYLPFQKDKQNVTANDIKTLFLQCTGHGSFYPGKVLQRFTEYTTAALQNFGCLAKVSIKLSGFDLDYEGIRSNIKQLCKGLEGKVKILQNVELRMTNLKSCQIKDLQQVLKIGFSMTSELNTLAYELSDWRFKRQPTFLQLEKTFQGVLSEKDSFPFKKFRLELSTFYLEKNQYDTFMEGLNTDDYEEKKIGGKPVTTKTRVFHLKFCQFISRIVNDLLPGLTQLELDLRNWHPLFEMQELKQLLKNIKTKNRYSGQSSILNKRGAQKAIRQSFIRQSLGRQKDRQVGISTIVNTVTKAKEEETFNITVVV